MAGFDWSQTTWGFPNPSTPTYSNLNRPSQQFVVDPLASDTRPEDTVVVDQAKLDRALQQYRQEQQAAFTRPTQPATYTTNLGMVSSSPATTTQRPTYTTNLGPMTASVVQPTNYNVADRVLGPQPQATFMPFQWQPQQTGTTYLGPMVSQPQVQPRQDKGFAYNIGQIQASAVQPSAWRSTPQIDAAKMSRQDLEDYAAIMGIQAPPMSAPATRTGDLQYDPGTRSWRPAQSTTYLPVWGRDFELQAPQPWNNVGVNVSPWRQIPWGLVPAGGR